MAFQLGIPILTLGERGVMQEGVLERGVMGLYCPEFDCFADSPFQTIEANSVLDQWTDRGACRGSAWTLRLRLLAQDSPNYYWPRPNEFGE